MTAVEHASEKTAEALAVVRELQQDLAAYGISSLVLHEPGSLQEHDIDLAIDSRSDRIWPTLERSASRRGFVPVWRAEYDVGGATYCIFARADGSEVVRLALDILTDLDGIGKYGVPIRTLLRAHSVRDGLVYPSPAWEATYLVAKQVWKGSWMSPALERAAQLAREDTRAFEQAASAVFGRSGGATLASRAGTGPLIRAPRERRRFLRMIRLRRALRCPWLPLLFVTRVLRRAADPTGLFVVVCGPDGAGKSALASSLLDELGPLFRRSTRMHWRPGLLPRLGAAVARKAPDGRDPHGSQPYGPVTSAVRFLYYWTDQVAGYWAKIWPIRARSGLIVLERGYPDMLVDPARYRMRVPGAAADIATVLVPTADITLVLIGDPGVLHARKAELDVDEIARQVETWRVLAGQIPRAQVIDVSRPFDDVFAEAASHVLAASHSAPARRHRAITYST